MPVEIEEVVEREPVIEASENAAATFSDLQKAVNDTTSQARAEIVQEASKRVTEAAAELQSKILTEMKVDSPANTEELKSALDEMNDMSKIDIMDTDQAIQAIDKALNGSNKRAIGQMTDIVKKSSQVFKDKINKIAESVFKGDKLSQFKKMSDIRDAACTELSDAISKGNKNAIDSAQAKLDAVEKQLNDFMENNPDLKEKIDSELGQSKASMLNKFLKYKNLLIGAGALFALWRIAKELTGCYMYKGTDSTHLPCPKSNDDGSCSCGDAPYDMVNSSDLQKLCSQIDSQGKQKYVSYPFCCQGPSPSYPTCSGKAGQENSVYYGWRQYSIAGIISSIPEIVKNVVNTTTDTITVLFKNVLKWVVIAIVIMILIYIFLRITRSLFEQKKSAFSMFNW